MTINSIRGRNQTETTTKEEGLRKRERERESEWTSEWTPEWETDRETCPDMTQPDLQPDRDAPMRIDTAEISARPNKDRPCWILLLISFNLCDQASIERLRLRTNWYCTNESRESRDYHDYRRRNWVTRKIVDNDRETKLTNLNADDRESTMNSNNKIKS